MMLNQLLFLTQPHFIGSRSWEPHDVADCGCPKRAKVLEERGIGFVVSRAHDYSEQLRRLREKGEDSQDIVSFLKQCKLRPEFAETLLVPEEPVEEKPKRLRKKTAPAD